MNELDEMEIITDSCRVCRAANIEDEFDSLFENAKNLSKLGKLYEELFNLKINLVLFAVQPQYICNTCDLQMKLFKKLKEKATISMQSLKLRESIDINDGCGKINANSDDMNTDSNDGNAHIGSFDKPLNGIFATQNRNNQNDNNKKSHNCGGDSEEVYTDCAVFLDDAESVLENHKISISCAERSATINNTVASCDEENSDEDLKIRQAGKPFTDVQYLEEFSSDDLDSKDQNSLPSNLRRSVCFSKFSSGKKQKTNRQNKLEKLKCSECPKMFYSKENFDSHMRVHQGLSPYACEICQKNFNHKAHFQHHMMRHNNVFEYHCNECGKNYVRKCDYKLHLRIHTNERNYECSICHKKYLQMEHLKQHSATHSNQKYECKLCEQKFTLSTSLRLHERSKHLDELNFQCEICDRIFKRKHHLIAHYSVHRRRDEMDKRNDKLFNESDDYDTDSKRQIENEHSNNHYDENSVSLGGTSFDYKNAFTRGRGEKESNVTNDNYQNFEGNYDQQLREIQGRQEGKINIRIDDEGNVAWYDNDGNQIVYPELVVEEEFIANDDETSTDTACNFNEFY